MNQSNGTVLDSREPRVLDPAKPSQQEQHPDVSMATTAGQMLSGIGCLSILFNIFDLVLVHWMKWNYGVIGHGLWTGLVCIAAGELSTRIGDGKNRNQVLSFAIVALVSGVLALAQFIIAVIGATRIRSYSKCTKQLYAISCEASGALEALLAVLAVFGVAAAIFGAFMSFRTTMRSVTVAPEAETRLEDVD